MLRNSMVLCLLSVAVTTLAQSLPLLNPSFEEGNGQPAHWSLSAGKGAWENQGQTGRRGVSVTGTGQDSSQWKSDVFPLAPGETYRFTYWARTDPGAQSGCITSGTDAVNRDYQAGSEWEKKTFIFKNPNNVSDGVVHLGQWYK